MPSRVVLVVFCLFLSLSCITQQARATDDQAAPASSQPASKGTAAIARWLDVQFATLTVRYRFVETSDDVVSANQVQYQELFRLRVKLDEPGRYSVHAGLFTGAVFNSTWNNTGIGTGAFGHRFSARQLFLSAQPCTWIELQAGGLYFWRGESTEITTYDNDGYIVGARLAVRRPRELFVDEVTYTQAHLDTLADPNVFRRFDGLDDVNYRQVGATKALGKRAAISGDYTVHATRDTLRGALRFDAPWLRVVDRMRLEGYRRFDRDEAGGFAVVGEKALTRRLTLTAGFSSIDEHFDGPNGDRYLRGHHVFAIGNVALSSDFTLQLFGGQVVHTDFPVSNAPRIDIVVIDNVLKTLQRHHILPQR